MSHCGPLCSEGETGKKKEHCDGSDYLPPIPHKFNEDNQGFVSWCHANLLTGGTETELDPQVQSVPNPPCFLSVSSVFVAWFWVVGGNQAFLFLAAYFVDPLNLQPKILILHLKLITTLNTHTFTPVFVC